MLFYPYFSKQAYYNASGNRANNHRSISFENTIINRESVSNYLGLLLDVKFNFAEHINAKIKKSNKVVSAIRKLHLR